MKKTILGILIAGLVIITAGAVIAKSSLEVNGSDEDKGKAEYVPDEIIVKYKGDKEPFRVVKLPSGKSVKKAEEEFEMEEDVEYAEPNYIVYTLMVPNDEYYSYQWHLDNPEYGGIGMEEAWDISTGDPSVVVAIVDTGIAYEDKGKFCQAPDLANTCFVAGYDFVNDDEHPNDDNRHGTHAAGTVAQSTNNEIGVAGVAFETCLMPVKVLNSRGSGTYADVAKGIRFAADNGAKVINLSLGGTSDSTTLKDAVAYAYEKGLTVVAACGNDDEPKCLYPAAYDDYVIAVGATQYDETKAPYSNYGPSLDLVAPGGNNDLDQNDDGYADGVLQQTFQSSWRVCNFAYYFFQGTSMAAPHVSGVAALLLANGNATTPDEVRTALRETAEDLGESGRDDTYGHGLVDAFAALNWALGPACSSDAECDDENLCTDDVCINPGTADAYCENTAVTDGTTCDDGKFCSLNDVCTAGVCEGIAKDCSDGIDCTNDSCDEDNDACLNTSNDALCDDGQYCNGAETCNATLSCQAGTPVNCDDGESCTANTCNETLNSCENTWPACGLVDACCGPACGGATDPDCSQAAQCWSADYQYLKRSSSQVRKFCKCASGVYDYEGYSRISSRQDAYYYQDANNNENWQTNVISNYRRPINRVECTENNWYNTNQDYYYSP